MTSQRAFKVLAALLVDYQKVPRKCQMHEEKQIETALDIALGYIIDGSSEYIDYNDIPQRKRTR